MTKEPDPLKAGLERLGQQDGRVPATPSDAQADYETAGELPLSREEVTAVVRHMVQRSREEEATQAGNGIDQDVAAQLAAARRRGRLWRGVALAQAAGIVLMVGLWIAGNGQGPETHAARDAPGAAILADGTESASPDPVALHDTTRLHVLTSYLTLRRQVLQCGADALPAPDVRAEPVPPVTMKELLRASS